MIINSDTRISRIIKHNEAALDAIIAINPVFEKLKNPLLRRIMAPRTSILMAARIGNCSPADFFKRLAPLGFKPDNSTAETTDPIENRECNVAGRHPIQSFDVREIIREGRDPLPSILKLVTSLKVGEAVAIINSFAPLPLIDILQKKGYTAHVEKDPAGAICTTFKKIREDLVTNKFKTEQCNERESILSTATGCTQYLDVRELQMPQPMLQILDKLQKLKEGDQLYVYHKRIPIYLLSELKTNGWQYRIKKINDTEVHVLIFKNDSCHK